VKIKLTEERYFPTLGILAQAGDEVDVPENVTEPAPIAATTNEVKSGAGKTAKNETVVNDGSTPQ
jgi:hypothetical protein